jgi:hypothetical protein
MVDELEVKVPVLDEAGKQPTKTAETEETDAANAAARAKVRMLVMRSVVVER